MAYMPEFPTYFNGLDRLEAAPEFTIEQWPASVQVQSKHNTPIEGFWRWKRQGEGHSIRESISIGNTEGLFNPNNELHVYVFQLRHNVILFNL
jgi:hypothetical protein